MQRQSLYEALFSDRLAVASTRFRRRLAFNGPGRPFGDSRQELRGRTEHPLGFRPCGVSTPDIGDQIPLDDLCGQMTGLPATTAQLPWDGPEVRMIERQGHAAGHAALFIKERGVLVAGDLLSDVLIPSWL